VAYTKEAGGRAALFAYIVPVGMLVFGANNKVDGTIGIA
jgi:hypothetical protein